MDMLSNNCLYIARIIKYYLAVIELRVVASVPMRENTLSATQIGIWSIGILCFMNF